jgi:hypothetical protein
MTVIFLVVNFLGHLISSERKNFAEALENVKFSGKSSELIRAPDGLLPTNRVRRAQSMQLKNIGDQAKCKRHAFLFGTGCLNLFLLLYHNVL